MCCWVWVRRQLLNLHRLWKQLLGLWNVGMRTYEKLGFLNFNSYIPMQTWKKSSPRLDCGSQDKQTQLIWRSSGSRLRLLPYLSHRGTNQNRRFRQLTLPREHSKLPFCDAVHVSWAFSCTRNGDGDCISPTSCRWEAPNFRSRLWRLNPNLLPGQVYHNYILADVA